MRTLSKPAGVPVFLPHDDPGGDSVLSRLLAEEPARAGVAWPRGFGGGIAHRLDRPTSGALAVVDDLAELAGLRDRVLDHDPRTQRMSVEDGPWPGPRVPRAQSAASPPGLAPCDDEA